MKIYPNDLCPCGSGMKYKKCCMNKSYKQTGMNKSLPVYKADENADFIVNKMGAVVYMDESKQPILEIPEGSITKRVLSVGFSHKHTHLATIQETEGAICYRLPDWYEDWCMYCVYLAKSGEKIFPSDVVFSLIDGKYSADIKLRRKR